MRQRSRSVDEKNVVENKWRECDTGGGGVGKGGEREREQERQSG